MLDKYTASFLSFLLAHYTISPLGGGTPHLSGREAVALTLMILATSSLKYKWYGMMVWWYFCVVHKISVPPPPQYLAEADAMNIKFRLADSGVESSLLCFCNQI